VVGLRFGIKGVALCYSLVLITILPWILNYAFRGTNLTLRRLGLVIVYPVSLTLLSVVFAEFMQHLVPPGRALVRLVAIALSFAIVYSLSSLMPRIRKEMSFVGELMSELRPRAQRVSPAV